MLKISPSRRNEHNATQCMGVCLSPCRIKTARHAFRATTLDNVTKCARIPFETLSRPADCVIAKSGATCKLKGSSPSESGCRPFRRKVMATDESSDRHRIESRLKCVLLRISRCEHLHTKYCHVGAVIVEDGLQELWAACLANFAAQDAHFLV